MAREVSKDHERKLLLERLFPTPFAPNENTLALFEICRELGDPYCLSFDEKGYTTDYKSFDSKEVISIATKLLTDDRLLYYAEKYKNRLNEYVDFKGRYYTYDHKTKTLKLGSEWEKIEEELDECFREHGKGVGAILRAIWEINVIHDKKWNNFHMVLMLAKKYGLEKGWWMILSCLELIGVIQRHKGDIAIPEELLPLVENVLRARDLI
jgi:hypothetical protein